MCYNILDMITNLLKMSVKSFSKSKAFTLAEVLITMGIIGVVAEMTIPTLMNNVQDSAFKSAYKKAFSVATQSLMQANNDNVLISRPTYGDITSRLANFNAFKSYFKISKDCNNSNNSECWANGENYSGYPVSNALAFIDSSGTAWSILGSDGSVNDEILVDTNGMKEPNKYGQDRFILKLIDITGSVSLGIPIKIIPYQDFPSYNASRCPSGNTHPCYNTTWLMN